MDFFLLEMVDADYCVNELYKLTKIDYLLILSPSLHTHQTFNVSLPHISVTIITLLLIQCISLLWL